MKLTQSEWLYLSLIMGEYLGKKSEHYPRSAVDETEYLFSKLLNQVTSENIEQNTKEANSL